MTKEQAKVILKNLLIEVMENGSATIELGTAESKALITILKS